MTIESTGRFGAADEVEKLRTVALARYPHTEDLLNGDRAVGGYDLEFADVTPTHRAFAPMVRELRYGVAELALVTDLLATDLFSEVRDCLGER